MPCRDFYFGFSGQLWILTPQNPPQTSEKPIIRQIVVEFRVLELWGCIADTAVPTRGYT